MQRLTSATEALGLRLLARWNSVWRRCYAAYDITKFPANRDAVLQAIAAIMQYLSRNCQLQASGLVPVYTMQCLLDIHIYSWTTERIQQSKCRRS